MLNAVLMLASNNTSNITSKLTQPATSLLSSGIESFLFPFLLVFAIVYGVLERSDIFKGKRDVNSIIAFVLAIVFASTSYTLKLTYIILPIVGVVAILIFMLLVLASMVYGNTAELSRGMKKTIMLIAAALSIILIIWVLVATNATGLSSKGVSNLLATYAPYAAVLIFLIVIGYILSK